MTEHSLTHGTFTLERSYPVPPKRVFAAWADAASKARWFAGPGVEHELDFRVDGTETVRGRHDGGPLLTFRAHYHDIVPDERIVYSGTLLADGRLSTVSVTSVEFTANGDGTELLLTEHGTYLDNQEQPGMREAGTSAWLDALTAELQKG